MIFFSYGFHPHILLNSKCRFSIVRDVVLLVGDHSGRKVSLILDFRPSLQSQQGISIITV